MTMVRRRAIRDQSAKPNSEHLPDGVGGTVTGAPLEPINLMEILSRSERCSSRGGAVSGAAQTVDSGEETRPFWGYGQDPGGYGKDLGIALSDGTRITFASIAGPGVLRLEDGRIALRNDRDDGTERGVSVRSDAEAPLFADT
jgi:hypothetical protein